MVAWFQASAVRRSRRGRVIRTAATAAWSTAERGTMATPSPSAASSTRELSSSVDRSGSADCAEGVLDGNACARLVVDPPCGVWESRAEMAASPVDLLMHEYTRRY